MGFFNEQQKALYDEARAAGGTLDQQLLKLSELAAREGTDPKDVATVRRWLSDQVIRETAR